MVKIYLSPSNQPYNSYCVGDTNEKVQMEDLSRQLYDILKSEYDCEVYFATIDFSIKHDGRPLEAKNLGCDVYLAIHSNASDKAPPKGEFGKCTGSLAFYHPNNEKSRELAENIVNELQDLCPIPSNRINPVRSGMEPFDGVGYAEVREPSNYGLCAVLAETDFHDNDKTAQWIMDNKNQIAISYAKALSKTFNIAKK